MRWSAICPCCRIAFLRLCFPPHVCLYACSVPCHCFACAAQLGVTLEIATKVLLPLAADKRLKHLQVLRIKDATIERNGRGLRPPKEDDILLPNAEFAQGKKRRVNIGYVEPEAIETEKLEMEQHKWRQQATEARIVRIMKARKTMMHNDLMAEVEKQVAHLFVAKRQDVKRCIEVLIERDFLERDEEDSNRYIYMA